MNFELATNIRTAINDTVSSLRAEPREATRTALQSHLDALLKEELRALTVQAPEGDLAGFAEQNEKFARDMGLRKDPEPPAPWYPDDSGEWVEVPDDCTVCPLPDGTFAHYLLRGEREGKDYADYSNPADELCWDLEPEDTCRIVAYKVVKP